VLSVTALVCLGGSSSHFLEVAHAAAVPTFVSAQFISDTTLEVTYSLPLTAIDYTKFTSAGFTATGNGAILGVKAAITINSLGNADATVSDMAIAAGAATGSGGASTEVLTNRVVADGQVSGGMPDQTSCNTGMGSLSWSTMGIARPVVASMTVDGETIADPTTPVLGSIGAAVCAAQDLGRFTGVYVYYHHLDGGNQMDLTGAQTPAGNLITSSSNIVLTLSNLGDNAQYYTFSLIHGTVSNWATANLGGSSASVNITLSPTRTPTGNGSDFSFCTATPPNCQATKSDSDVLSASLYMLFDRTGMGTDVRGSYFALTGAMGGFVTATTDSTGAPTIQASLGAPHFLANGTTPNVGSMQAFIPTAVMANFLHLSETVDSSSLTVARTESGTTTDSAFTVTPVSGGYLVAVNNITFSSPVYSIKKLAAVTSTATAPGLPNTGQAPQKSTSPWSVLLLLAGSSTGFYLLRKRG